MDDTLFQKWSDALSALRLSRQSSFSALQKEKGPDFSPADFVDVAKASLENALTKWWEYETGSGDKPDDLLSEMESVVDFEMEAIDRDFVSLENQVSWNAKTINEQMSRLRGFSNELKQMYESKIKLLKKTDTDLPSFAPVESSSSPQFTPLPPAPSLEPSPLQAQRQAPRAKRSGSSGGSGVALFLMFLLGLLIGTGPSIYFWDLSKKADATNEEKISQLTSEKRALEDNLGVFQQTFIGLANGKTKSIAQLEDAMRPIREEIAGRRRKIEKDFAEKRESLMKKVPSGDRLDRAIERLKEIREEDLAVLDAELKTRLEPYLKQLQVLRELMGQ